LAGYQRDRFNKRVGVRKSIGAKGGRLGQWGGGGIGGKGGLGVPKSGYTEKGKAQGGGEHNKCLGGGWFFKK